MEDYDRNELYQNNLTYLKNRDIEEKQKEKEKNKHREISSIENRFKDLAFANLTTLTIIDTSNFTIKDEDVLFSHLGELEKRSQELDGLANDYSSGCGLENIHINYANAVVAGELAREKILNILELSDGE